MFDTGYFERPRLRRPHPFQALGRVLSGFKARAAQKLVAFMFPSWSTDSQLAYFDRSFENYVKEGYKKNEVIFACTEATATTAATVAMRIHNKATGEEQPDHGLQALIKRPNKKMSEYDFWSWTIRCMKLAGVCYWQKRRNAVGQIVDMWPIRPDYIRPNVVEDVGLVSYKVHIGGQDVMDIPADDMLVFGLPDPLNLFSHMSPIEVCARIADVDNGLTDLIKMLLMRGATPLFILVSKLRLQDDAVGDIRRRWAEKYSGWQNWAEPAVLDSDASYQRVGLTLDELKIDSLTGQGETRICMVMRVPPIIIGATFGLQRSTFSNYESARKQWWEDVLSALYKQLADVYQQGVVEEYDADAECRWDFSTVPALQEERTARFTRSTNAYAKGVITKNEARIEMGFKSIGPKGDVFCVSTLTIEEPENAPDADTDDTADDTVIAEDTEQDADIDGQSEGGKPAKPGKVQGKAQRLKTIDVKAAKVAKAATEDEPVKAHGKKPPTSEVLKVEPLTQDRLDQFFEVFNKLKTPAKVGEAAVSPNGKNKH